MHNKNTIILGACLFSGLVLLATPSVGEKIIYPADIFSSRHTLESHIYWQIRFPRTLIAYLSGGSLAVGGMCFQALFRNPLATPFTLGVASGASFFAVVAAYFGLVCMVGNYAFPGIFPLLGALGTIAFLYLLAQHKERFSDQVLLLAGVAVNYFLASAVVFIQYLSDYTNIFRVLRVLLGSFEGVSYATFAELLPFILPSLLILSFYRTEMNLISLGDELAIGRGLDLNRARKIMFFATSLIVAGVVSIAGPIGFIGIIAPHICRLLIGNNHRYLMPLSFNAGGILLCLCDTLAKTLIAPGEIPVGTMTALIGGPFFLWLLVQKRDF